MTARRWWWFACSVLCVRVALAQSYAGSPCHPTAPSALAEQLQHGELRLSARPLYRFYDDWSSSFLASSAAAPSPAQVCASKKLPRASVECEEAAAEAKDLSTCQYSAYRVQDGDPKTAWCEGKDGPGVGETVLVAVDWRKPLRIWNGYGKTATHFSKNNRAQRVRVWRLQAPQYQRPTTTEGTSWAQGQPRVVDHVDVVLQDVNGYQTVALPPLATSPAGATFVAIEILSVYAGTQSPDTCISEVRN